MAAPFQAEVLPISEFSSKFYGAHLSVLSSFFPEPIANLIKMYALSDLLFHPLPTQRFFLCQDMVTNKMVVGTFTPPSPPSPSEGSEGSEEPKKVSILEKSIVEFTHESMLHGMLYGPPRFRSPIVSRKDSFDEGVVLPSGSGWTQTTVTIENLYVNLAEHGRENVVHLPAENASLVVKRLDSHGLPHVTMVTAWTPSGKLYPYGIFYGQRYYQIGRVRYGEWFLEVDHAMKEILQDVWYLLSPPDRQQFVLNWLREVRLGGQGVQENAWWRRFQMVNCCAPMVWSPFRVSEPDRNQIQAEAWTASASRGARLVTLEARVGVTGSLEVDELDLGDCPDASICLCRALVPCAWCDCSHKFAVQPSIEEYEVAGPQPMAMS